MTNKFASTYRSLESSNYFFGSYMTNGRQRVKTRRHQLAQYMLYIVKLVPWYKYYVASEFSFMCVTFSILIVILLTIIIWHK